MNAPNPTVTLTLDVIDLRELFMAANHCGGGTASDADPLYLALDIIEHAAMELHTLHDALRGQEDRAEELANHARRLSKQLTSGVARVHALKKATVTGAPQIRARIAGT